MTRFLEKDLKQENKKLDQIEGIIASFNENPMFATGGDLTPGSMFGVRWGLQNDGVVVFRLDPDFVPEKYDNVLDANNSKLYTDASCILAGLQQQPAKDIRVAALHWIRTEYKKKNPARTGDTHDPSCRCMRCLVDAIDGYLEDPAVKR